MDEQNKETTLEYVFREPQEKSSGDRKPPLLLLLHGFGSNEKDLIGFAPFLDKQFFIASARAPFSIDWGGFAWFELRYTAHGVDSNLAQAEESRKLLIKFVDEIAAKHDLDAERIFLAGFSQGVIMIYSLILSAPEKFAGAVAMSGVLAHEHLLKEIDAERLRDFPIFVSHGVHDMVLTVDNGRKAKAVLEKLPVRLDYKEYPIAHNVSDESLADVAAWLRARLNER